MRTVCRNSMFQYVTPMDVPYLSLSSQLCRKDLEGWDCSRRIEMETPVLWMLPGFPLERSGTHRWTGNGGGHGFPVTCPPMTGGPLAGPSTGQMQAEGARALARALGKLLLLTSSQSSWTPALASLEVPVQLPGGLWHPEGASGRGPCPLPPEAWHLGHAWSSPSWPG